MSKKWKRSVPFMLGGCLVLGYYCTNNLPATVQAFALFLLMAIAIFTMFYMSRKKTYRKATMNFIQQKGLLPAESLYEGLHSYQNDICIVSFGQMSMKKVKDFYQSALQDYRNRMDVYSKERIINNVFKIGKVMEITSMEGDFEVHFGYIHHFVFMHSCLDEENRKNEIGKLVQSYL